MTSESQTPNFGILLGDFIRFPHRRHSIHDVVWIVRHAFGVLSVIVLCLFDSEHLALPGKFLVFGFLGRAGKQTDKRAEAFPNFLVRHLNAITSDVGLSASGFPTVQNDRVGASEVEGHKVRGWWGSIGYLPLGKSNVEEVPC
jgi:hypothetical protein